MEQVSVDTARFATRNRSLMSAPLADVVGDRALGASTARVALPLEQMPKGPLLGYDVSVDGKPAYVVPRGATAEIEAAHVMLLAGKEGVTAPPIVAQFVRAICEFTPWPWKRVRVRHRLRFRRALLEYLEEGLAPFNTDEKASALSLNVKRWERLLLPVVIPLGQRLAAKYPSVRGRYPWIPRPPRTAFALTLRQVQSLRADALQVGATLRSALGEGSSPTSSADTPLLAAPLLAQASDVGSLSELSNAVAALRDFVQALAKQVKHPRESEALVALADYGRRWETIVACEVPLDRPFIVRTQRQVPLRVRRPRSWVRQRVELRDARSNHVVFRVADENVEIAKAQLKGLDEEPLEHTYLNGLAASSEHYALYASEPDRDRRAFIDVRLKVARSIRISATVIHAIIWLSVALTASLGFEGSLDSADLAVLAVPTTFGAALVLTRERTSLARRLQWVTRVGTPVAVAALWVVVGWLYLGDYLTT